MSEANLSQSKGQGSATESGQNRKPSISNKIKGFDEIGKIATRLAEALADGSARRLYSKFIRRAAHYFKIAMTRHSAML